VSYDQLNAFLARAAGDERIRERLRHADAREAAVVAANAGFEVTVGDLTRYKARATTWELSDDELAVVTQWQPREQPYWWQHIQGC